MLRSKVFYIFASGLLFMLLAYLGIRTLEHEVLLRQYQAQTLAQAQASQVETTLNGILQQSATRLSAISEFIDPLNIPALQKLTDKEADIESVFVLRKNELIYPDDRQPLSRKTQEWIRLIMPLVNDPSQLYSHTSYAEQETPKAGWYIANEAQEPVLIYWRLLGDVVLGFRLSYVNLMMEATTTIQVSGDNGEVVRVLENGRLLYQNQSADLSALKAQETRILPWPLLNWQIIVYAKSAPLVGMYLWGGVMIVLVLAAVALLGFSLYREATRTASQARQQVNFVSQVSHELKTPLTNITLYAELLREGLEDDQQQELRYIDVITHEGQRLSRLIQNILTFTKAPQLHWQAVDLNRQLREIVHFFTPALSAKGMVIRLECPPDITLQTDRDSLVQIINNFLSNAQKYASQGKQVDVVVNAEPERINIAVRDYGPGIQEKERKMIFRPFYRSKTTLTEGVSGTGIGLTIAQQLAHRLKGEIIVTPEQPGIRFTLSLPLQPNPACEDTA